MKHSAIPIPTVIINYRGLNVSSFETEHKAKMSAFVASIQLTNKPPALFSVVIPFENMRIESRASQMLGKYSIFESHSSSTYIHFNEYKKEGNEIKIWNEA